MQGTGTEQCAREAGGIIDWTLSTGSLKEETFKLELNDKKEEVIEEQGVEITTRDCKSSEMGRSFKNTKNRRKAQYGLNR